MTSKKPILYSYFRSSCSWRVRTALEYKGIEYEYRPVNLLKTEQLDAEFGKVNPMQQVPALVVDGDKTLTQSASIIEYLEEKYPQKPLLPKDALKRAKVREIYEIIGSGIQPIQNLAVLKRVGEQKKVAWGHDFIRLGFVGLERVLRESSGKYCVGDEVTMADLFLVPQVFNGAVRFNVDMTEFPTITRVNDNLLELNAFKKAHPYTQVDCPAELKKVPVYY